MNCDCLHTQLHTKHWSQTAVSFQKYLKTKQKQWSIRERCRAVLKDRGQDGVRTESGSDLEAICSLRYYNILFCLVERVQWRDCVRLKRALLAILMQSTALLQPVWDSRDSLKWLWQGPSVNLPVDHRKPCTCSRLYHGAPPLYMHIAYGSTHAEYMRHYGP